MNIWVVSTLAIMSNAVVNTRVPTLYVNVMFSVLFGMHLEVELLGHMVNLCLAF